MSPQERALAYLAGAGRASTRAMARAWYGNPRHTARAQRVMARLEADGLAYRDGTRWQLTAAGRRQATGLRGIADTPT